MATDTQALLMAMVDHAQREVDSLLGDLERFEESQGGSEAIGTEHSVAARHLQDMLKQAALLTTWDGELQVLLQDGGGGEQSVQLRDFFSRNLREISHVVQNYRQLLADASASGGLLRPSMVLLQESYVRLQEWSRRLTGQLRERSAAVARLGSCVDTVSLEKLGTDIERMVKSRPRALGFSTSRPSPLVGRHRESLTASTQSTKAAKVHDLRNNLAMLSAQYSSLPEPPLPFKPGSPPDLFWRKAFGSVLVVNAADFEAAWRLHDSICDADALECLRYVLDPFASGFISAQALAQNAARFAPFAAMTVRIVRLLRCSWFHGHMSGIESERMLALVPRGSYLVRLSSTSNNGFVLSWSDLDSGTVCHAVVEVSPNGRLLVATPEAGEFGEDDCMELDSWHELFARYAAVFSVPAPNTLSIMPSFHGYLMTPDAMALLREAPVGSFAFRYSSRSPHLAVSYCYEAGQVAHSLIEALDDMSQFYLDDVPDERFPSLDELVRAFDHMFTNPILHPSYNAAATSGVEERFAAARRRSSGTITRALPRSAVSTSTASTSTAFSTSSTATSSVARVQPVIAAESSDSDDDGAVPITTAGYVGAVPGGMALMNDTGYVQASVGYVQHTAAVGYVEPSDSGYVAAFEPNASASSLESSTATHSKLLEAVEAAAKSTEGHRMALGKSTSFRAIPMTEIVRKEKPIGRGAFGVVYRGRWRGTDVAIKKIFSSGSSESQLEQFFSEVEILQHVSGHRNVLDICGVAVGSGSLYMVTPFYEKGSLFDMLVVRRENIGWPTVLRFARDAAAGMLHLHMEDVVHRDLSCRNILVDESNIARVADFGLSRVVRGSSKVNQQLGGNVFWMAPEAFSRHYSPASDVFAFAVCLWEMCARDTPVNCCGTGPMEWSVVVMRDHARLPIPENTPPPWKALIEDCWAHSPEDRPNFDTIIDRLADMRLE